MSCKMIDWLCDLQPMPCPPLASLLAYAPVRRARLMAQPVGYQDYLADEKTIAMIRRLEAAKS